MANKEQKLMVLSAPQPMQLLHYGTTLWGVLAEAHRDVLFPEFTMLMRGLENPNAETMLINHKKAEVTLLPPEWDKVTGFLKDHPEIESFMLVEKLPNVRLVEVRNEKLKEESRIVTPNGSGPIHLV